MSRFYVGQRVRIKYNMKPWGAICVGKEATILALVDELYALDVDGVPRPSPQMPWLAAADQLEPITDSYDITTWDQCVWQPEHLRTTA